MSLNTDFALDLTRQVSRATAAKDLYARVDSMSQMSGMSRSTDLDPELDEALTELNHALSKARRLARLINEHENSKLTSMMFQVHTMAREVA